MTLHLRPATPEDYPLLVDLQNVLSPDSPVTLKQFQRREASRDPALVHHRYLAELGGQPVGQGYYGQQEWMVHPHKFALSVQVRPEVQGQGVGTALWTRLEEEVAALKPEKLFVQVRADRAAALRFVHRRGFTEEQRVREVALDLSVARLNGLGAALERVWAQGYAISTFADYSAPDKEARYYALDLEASQDSPMSPGETLTMPTLELYWQRIHTNPDHDPTLSFVAVKGGELAGLTQLAVFNSALPDVLRTGFTGVARNHRRQGLALALKLVALTEAHRRGYRQVRTTNDSTNAPMIAVNTALGFTEQSCYLWMARKTAAG